MAITVKNIKHEIDCLNILEHGSADQWDEVARKPLIGRYNLDRAYGGYKLCRYVGNGGETEITNYRMSAREIYYVISSIVKVLEHNKREGL